MKNAIIFILAVIIILMGWAYYKSVTSRNQIILQSGVGNNGGSANSELLTASFMCQDNSHFIAKFPVPRRLDVVVDGQTLYTLPLVPGAGYRYENASVAYVFAGEEANVINKTTGKSTACSQPFDPNNSPVNFGDAGEGGGTAQVDRDIPALVSQSIGGKWRSTTDAKFVREFRDGGAVIDYYNGKKVSEGKWVVFDSSNATSAKVSKVSFPVEAGAVYVQMIVSASSADNLNFKITKLTPESLDLVYMDRGGNLSFTRIN